MLYNVYLNCGSWCISTDLHLVYLEVVVYIYTKYLYLDGGWMCISTHSISILGWWCISTLSVSRRWVVEYIYTEYLYRRWGVWRHRPGPRHLPVDTPVCTRRHGHTIHIYTYLHISTCLYIDAHLRICTYISTHLCKYLNSIWNTYISTHLTINWYSLFWISGIHIPQTEQFRNFAKIDLILQMLF